MEVKPKIETFARIKVLGIGGSGTNAVDRMSELGISGVEFIAINTDAQSLHNNRADRKVHIGKTITKGLGSGMNPDLGRLAAEESIEEIEEVISNADMVFITCGLGGGTGTGAAPVVAELSKSRGILTVAVVTKPFSFEGTRRREIAEQGYENLKDKVDAIISIQNDRILQIIDKSTSIQESFTHVDDILRQGISGISDLITKHGVVNADFADVGTIMRDAGTALIGMGRASGENRAAEAAKTAINSPLLDLNIDGAMGVLFNITGNNVGMLELQEAAQTIMKTAHPEATVKWGHVEDPELGDEIRITVIATGFENALKLRGLNSSGSSAGPAQAFSGPAYSQNSYYQTQPAAVQEERRQNNSLFSVPDPFGQSGFSDVKRSAPAARQERTPEPVVNPGPPSNFGPQENLESMYAAPNRVPIPEPNFQKDSDAVLPVEEDLDIPAFLRKKIR